MTDMFTTQDEAFMRAALELARNGEGRVSPNPPVGCVLAKDGAVVGQGWHDRYGDLHAEAAAIRDAGPRAAGSTAYVTLTPCATTGRQPPCTDALLEAGVAEVVAATRDPNPKNCCGLDVLREAGVATRFGLLREEAEYLARGFFKTITRGMPYLTLKYAMTLDGKIAASTGDSRWVSGAASRERVQDMRSRSDAVLVGSGTALADDPRLNVREPALSGRGGAGTHPQPLRVVVDSACRIAPNAALFRTDEPGGKVLVATCVAEDSAQAKALARAGAEIVSLPGGDGRVSLAALLRRLSAMRVNTVLCEGGGRLAAGLLREGLIDEVVTFVAPKVIGGDAAPGPVSDLGLGLMADALRFTVRECNRLGDDIVIKATPRPAAAKLHKEE